MKTGLYITFGRKMVIEEYLIRKQEKRNEDIILRFNYYHTISTYFLFFYNFLTHNVKENTINKIIKVKNKNNERSSFNLESLRLI